MSNNASSFSSADPDILSGGQPQAAGFRERIRHTIPIVTRFVLIAGLSYLSWLATYSGIVELIKANHGTLETGYEVAIAFATLMLMLMIIYLLDSMFSPISWWLRISYIAGYVFLTIISVGFGFGFYWKLLESRSESNRSALLAIQEVESVLATGQSRLEQLQATFKSLTTVSATKAELEREFGQTCPQSIPGDGPRGRLRDNDARKFETAGDYVKRRAGLIRNDLSSVNAQISLVHSGADKSTQARKLLFQTLNQQLNLTIAKYNAFRTDPQLKLYRDSFDKRARQTIFDDGRSGSFHCPDPQIEFALTGAVKAIDELPHLHDIRIASVEGADAIVEAFGRLASSSFSLLPHVSSGHSQNGLRQRDVIPLFLAFFVDFCILLISINRPVNRLQSFLNIANRANNQQMHQILKSFHDVHNSRRSERLDIIHDVMFDIGARQYVAVPLDLRARPDSRESAQDFLDHKKRLTQARYLATLMATLEEAGLVSKSRFTGSRRARRSLRKLKSPYANAPAFRVYQFRKGAWPAIILEDILGESKSPGQEKRLLPPPLPPERISETEGKAPQSVNATLPIHNDSPEDSSLALERIMRKEIEICLMESAEAPQAEEYNCTWKENMRAEGGQEGINFHHHRPFSNEDTAPIEIDKIAQQFAPRTNSKNRERTH